MKKAEASLKDIGSEQPFPAGLPSVFTVIDQVGRSPQANGQLLELRTEDGPVFVRPSRWQRMRLRRAFRYFHVVPQQLLSGSHRRLIAELLRTSVVTPNRSVASDAVFGVVENVHAKSPLDGPLLVVERPEPPRPLSFLPPPAIQMTQPPERQKDTREVTSPPAASVAREAGLWPWIVSGAAAAAFIPLIMASVYCISLLKTPPKVAVSHRTATPLSTFAKEEVPTSRIGPDLLIKNSQPNLPVRKHMPAAHSQLKAQHDQETATAPPRFVSELPPGYFAHPMVASPNLVGEVRLKALVGADGAVQRVTVLSGNPKLAQAAMRAVKRWHYSPYEVMGDPVAVETAVKMSFFGPDAVSIASLANASSSPLK